MTVTTAPDGHHVSSNPGPISLEQLQKIPPLHGSFTSEEVDRCILKEKAILYSGVRRYSSESQTTANLHANKQG